MKILSGMPVLLHLKVVPESGHITRMARVRKRRYNSALIKILQKVADEITADVVATFKQETEAEENFLSFAIVRSKPDHDTKQAVKPFLDYLDNTRELEMQSGKMTHSVRFTSRVRLWTEMDETRIPYTTIERLEDLDLGVQDPPLLYSKPTFRNIYYQIYQVLSPLIYCPQIQLNRNEFIEKDVYLVINTTTSKISLPYYYYINMTDARVCANHYLRQPKNIGAKFDNLRYYIIVMLIHVAFMILVCYTK